MSESRYVGLDVDMLVEAALRDDGYVQAGAVGLAE